jgi:hypothetical protein
MSETPPPTLISMTLIVVTRVLERLQERLRNAQSPEPDPSEQPYDDDPLIRRSPITADIPAPIGERHKRAIPQAVKIAVSARDGGRCRKCGSTQQLHFDHVIPVSKGGANTAANIQLLCGACNRAKGARLPVQRRRVAGVISMLTARASLRRSQRQSLARRPAVPPDLAVPG